MADDSVLRGSILGAVEAAFGPSHDPRPPSVADAGSAGPNPDPAREAGARPAEASEPSAAPEPSAASEPSAGPEPSARSGPSQPPGSPGPEEPPSGDPARLDDIAAGALAQAMLEDPDPEARREAARAMAGAPQLVGEDVLRRGLLDPMDGVRAQAVALAAARGPSTLPLILPLATDRGWPLAQDAALRELPALIRGAAELDDASLNAFLDAVGALDPPPLRTERPALASIARSIDRRRLAGSLAGPERRRLGAAWLLFLENGSESLATVAQMSEDGSERVRELAAMAARVMARSGWGREGAEGEGTALQGAAQAGSSTDVAVAALAAALSDPDDEVRSAAALALRGMPRVGLLAWIRDALRFGSDRLAEGAASVVERLELGDAAPLLLARACRTASASQSPIVRSLASFRSSPEALIELVAAVDPTLRQAAVRLAWQIGGREVIPHLRRLLGDTSGPVRMAVLEVIGESGDPAAVGLASDLLAGDSSAAVRAAAVHLLARAASPARLDAFLNALADPDPDVRATAVQHLPQGEGWPGSGALLSALRDDDQRVWRAALGHLASQAEGEEALVWTAIRESPPEKREELIRAVEEADHARLELLAISRITAEDRGDRELAVRLAARAGTPEGTAAVVAALRDPDPRVRQAAAQAMTTLRTSSAVDALAERLSDPDIEVRIAAVRGLSVIDDDGVPSVLISALRDPELRVRQVAAEALTRWRSPAVARRLAAALRSPELRRPIGEVLERMGQPAVEPLVGIVVGSDPEAAAEAGSVLERIVGPEPFVRSTSSTDPDQRLRAVSVLGAMGGPTAVDALLASLSDPEPGVRSRAASLLGGLGEPRAAPALRRMVMGDPVPEVSQAAEAALRALDALNSRSASRASRPGVGNDLPHP